jgi:RNA polymerase sigma-70 factor (ECF subfamily)
MQSTMATTPATQADTFAEHRPLLFSISYRMLGSVMDAEDIVQEAYLRWQAAPRAEVISPKSFLSTVVTRLCIDELRSARVRREQYAGPWLPEPIVTEEQPMEEHAALADSLSLAFLVLLENLSPTERAVFLLRDVFDYDYIEIARMVDKSEANCRQILSRARRKIRERQRPYQPSHQHVTTLLERFVQAAQNGDMHGLLELLADDVTLWSDGGGKTAAARNPVHGPDRVARLVVGLMKKAPPQTEFRLAYVNGKPGVVIYVFGQPYTVSSFDFDGDKIAAYRVIVNPDKLRRVPSLN